MTRVAMLVLGAGLLTAVPLRAAGDHEMLAAEQELKIAKDHLQKAGTDYEGHRRAAIRFIDQALHEIRQGLKISRARSGQPEASGERKGEP